jgi:hypothetical protein
VKSLSSAMAIAALHLVLGGGTLAFAAPKETTTVKPVAPTKEKQTNLTDGECFGLAGTIKKVIVQVCVTGKECQRVDQDGVVIKVGCIDDVKH